MKWPWRFSRASIVSTPRRRLLRLPAPHPPDCRSARLQLPPADTVRVRGMLLLDGSSCDRRIRLCVIGSAASRDAASQLRPEAGLAPVPTIQDPLIIPRSSESAIERARLLFESGRLYDAMRAVDLIRPTDPLRAEADTLKGAIQRELLTHLPPTPAGSVPVKP